MTETDSKYKFTDSYYKFPVTVCKFILIICRFTRSNFKFTNKKKYYMALQCLLLHKSYYVLWLLFLRIPALITTFFGILTDLFYIFKFCR